MRSRNVFGACKTTGDPALQEQQDVEMPVEVPGGSASVKRGADAVADTEERARLRLRAEGPRGQKHDMQDVLEHQAKSKARLESRRGQKRVSTQLLEGEVGKTTFTVPVVCGSVPIQGGSSSSTDVLVQTFVAANMSRGHGTNQCPCVVGCWNPTCQFWYSWIAVFQSKTRMRL